MVAHNKVVILLKEGLLLKLVTLLDKVDMGKVLLLVVSLILHQDMDSQHRLQCLILTVCRQVVDISSLTSLQHSPMVKVSPLVDLALHPSLDLEPIHLSLVVIHHSL